MNREQIETVLTDMGWAKDGHGHFKKELTRKMRNRETQEVVDVTREFRVKMQATSLRVEIMHVGPPRPTYNEKAHREWVRYGGEYYSNIKLVEGRLVIGSLTLGAKRAVADGNALG